MNQLPLSPMNGGERGPPAPFLASPSNFAEPALIRTIIQQKEITIRDSKELNANLSQPRIPHGVAKWVVLLTI